VVSLFQEIKRGRKYNYIMCTNNFDPSGKGGLDVEQLEIEMGNSTAKHDGPGVVSFVVKRTTDEGNMPLHVKADGFINCKKKRCSAVDLCDLTAICGFATVYEKWKRCWGYGG
jgi:hypothetical protein